MPEKLINYMHNTSKHLPISSCYFIFIDIQQSLQKPEQLVSYVHCGFNCLPIFSCFLFAFVSPYATCRQFEFDSFIQSSMHKFCPLHPLPSVFRIGTYLIVWGNSPVPLYHIPHNFCNSNSIILVPRCNFVNFLSNLNILNTQ